jgi:hypothetical protein
MGTLSKDKHKNLLFNTLNTNSSQLLHASNRAASAVPHLSCFGLLRFNSRNA